MPRLIPCVLLGLVLGLSARADDTHAVKPWATAEWSVETGMLWQVGHLTPIAYRLAPLQLSWKSHATLRHEYRDGSSLVLRHRFTLLADSILRGPESHYVGFSCSPSIEWWNQPGNWSVFTGAGGGFGWIDSRGVAGGQGQDFTLNWFIRGGVEHITEKNVHLSAGLMYQHMSNGGKTDPNPGIDALGFMLGYAWSF